MKLTARDLEALYDFKKIMVSTCPEIVFATEDDCHGEIEKTVASHIAELTQRQWEAVFDSRYSELFQDGTPHISWNTDRSHILSALLSKAGRERGFETLATDNWEETWRSAYVQWIRTPCGAVVKYKREEPRVWDSYSRTTYCGKVVPPEEVPPRTTHCVAILAVDGFGKAYLADQHCGTQDACEQWAVDALKRYGRDDRVFVKFMDLEKR